MYQTFDDLVEVTITATNRREVLFRTLTSFMENLLFRCHVEAIINIDDIGDSAGVEKVIRTVELFMPVKCSRQSLESNFGEAFKYCWQSVESDWVFHLEDDWELLERVEIREMVDILNEEKDLALLRLPQFKSNEKDMKNWNKFFPWNGKYFECPKDLIKTVGFCGHPSLIKGEFVKKCAPLIDGSMNPEKQFHSGNGPLLEEVMKWRYGVFSKPNSPAYIKDLGREWMVKNNFVKKGSKAYFTVWEKSDGKK